MEAPLPQAAQGTQTAAALALQNAQLLAVIEQDAASIGTDSHAAGISRTTRMDGDKHRTARAQLPDLEGVVPTRGDEVSVRREMERCDGALVSPLQAIVRRLHPVTPLAVGSFPDADPPVFPARGAPLAVGAERHRTNGSVMDLGQDGRGGCRPTLRQRPKPAAAIRSAG